jgi:putative DNA primase/helicase
MSNTSVVQKVKTSFLDLALPLIKRGLYVFPTSADGKKIPLIKDWPNAAANDRRTVEYWSAIFDHDVNVGVVARGVVILDDDRGDLAEVIERKTGHKLPTTYTVRTGVKQSTGRRGMHYYFAETEQSLLCGWRKKAGVYDFQAEHHQVVGAGSRHHSGLLYEEVDPKQRIVPIPDWLVDWVLQTSDAVKVSKSGSGDDLPVNDDFDFADLMMFYDITGSQDGDYFVTDICPVAGRKHQQSTKTGFRWDGNHLGWHCFASDCDGSTMTVGQVIKRLNEEKGEFYPKAIWPETPIAEILDAFQAEAADEPTPPEIDAVKQQATKVPEVYPVEWSGEKNDAGNAELLARYFGYDIIFVPEAGQKGGYFVWTGSHWEFDKGNVRMMGFAKQVSGILLVEASKLDGDKKDSLAGWAIKSGNVSMQRNMIESVRTLVRTVHKSEFNRKPMVYNCADGTVDLSTGTIRTFHRDDLLTKQTNHRWQPGADVQPWLKFLDDVFMGDRELIAFIQRTVGYILTGLTSEECLFIGYGTGRNGKGKFSDALIHLMGEGVYARPAKFDMFVARKGDEGKANDIAELFGARYVPASEGEQSKRLSESKVKNMVSGDPVEGEKKYQDSFTYYPEYKIWLFSNYKPRIVGTDEGIWDKVIFIPFKRYFKPEERDKRLLDKLKACISGILQWAIEGCLEWQKRGLNTPESVLRATKAYRDEQNVLGHFIEDELIQHPKLNSPKGRMYAAYKEWAEKNGEFVTNNTEFNERMSMRFDEGRTSASKIWKGVGIKKLLSNEDNLALKGIVVDTLIDAI